MIYACDFQPPFRHSVPMQHAFMQKQPAEWPDECIWWQLKSERYDFDRMGDDYGSKTFLANLEIEWERRGLCSHCMRAIDQPLAERFAELESRARNAEDKLGGIRRTAMERPDITLRPEIVKILDEP